VLSSYAVCDDDGLRRCPGCHRVDRPFERAAAHGSYDRGLPELIHLPKFHGVTPAADVLVRMLAEAIEKLDLGDTVLVVPVPRYRSKRRQRGFNQAELIVRTSIKASPSRERLQLAPGILLRIRDTQSQIGLTSHQRRENLRGAFSVARAAEVNGREVLLVDDVYTTGTTASECARVLRRGGASKVFVATVARTLKPASNTEGFEVSEFQGFKNSPVSGESNETLAPEHLETSKP